MRGGLRVPYTIGPPTRPARCSRRISRRRLLRVGWAGVSGAALLGVAGCGASGEGADGSSGTRTVRHELGRAEVPARPRRVVAMDPYASLQTALAVGSPVVGSPTFPDEPFPGYLGNTAGVEGLGYDQPSLEKIAALKPDLIVGWVDWIEYHEAYDELSRIAPTVAARSTYDWKENSRVVADALNARRKVEKLISDHEDRLGKLKESLGGRSERPTVSVLKPREDVLEAYTDRFYVGRILEEVGVRRPEGQLAEDPQEISRELGQESVSEADADVIFLMVGGGGEDEEASRDALGRLRSNPLWGRLRAVKNDRVHEVDPNAWFITSGPQAANVVLDDLEKHLLGGNR